MSEQRQGEKDKTGGEEDCEQVVRQGDSSQTPRRRKPEPPELPPIPQIPEAVDDFLRNFLRRLGMTRTLNSFEAEWYGSAQRLQTESVSLTTAGVSFIPDALIHRQLLLLELEEVGRETELLREEMLRGKESMVRMQKEREFHRTQYGKVLEEKKKIQQTKSALNRQAKFSAPQLEDAGGVKTRGVVSLWDFRKTSATEQ